MHSLLLPIHVCTGDCVTAKMLCSVKHRSVHLHQLVISTEVRLSSAELLLHVPFKAISSAPMCHLMGSALSSLWCLCRGTEQEEWVGYEAACGCCHWGVHRSLHSPRAQVRLQAQECQFHQHQRAQVSVSTRKLLYVFQCSPMSCKVQPVVEG